MAFKHAGMKAKEGNEQEDMILLKTNWWLLGCQVKLLQIIYLKKHNEILGQGELLYVGLF